MSGAFIETHRLGKRYGGPAGGEGSWAVRGVTLSVFAGDVTVLMGPSGSGKTTLLSMLGGLLEPTEGALCVCGTLLDQCGEPERQALRREKIGFIFQNYNLLEALNAAENVGVGLALRGDDPARAGEPATLTHHLTLDDGTTLRVGIARGLAEPYGGLDALDRRRVHT